MQWPWVSRKALKKAEDKYFWLRYDLREAMQWLGEYEEVEMTLTWLLNIDTDRWRSLETKALTGPLHSIDNFREYLQRVSPRTKA